LLFIFHQKKSGEQKAKQKIHILLENIFITTIGKSVARNAIENPKSRDFENGLEYIRQCKNPARLLYIMEYFYNLFIM